MLGEIQRQFHNVIKIASFRYFNCNVLHGIFPEELNFCDISAIFTTDDRYCNKNYIPIITLPSMSKTFERLIKVHVGFCTHFPSHLLYGIRECYRTWNAFARSV